MKIPAIAPGTRLAASTAFGLIVVGLVIAMAASRPWLGLALAWDASSGTALVAASTGPAGSIPAGTRLVSVSAGGPAHVFSALDSTIEPDGNLATYTEYREFLASQDRLASIQAEPSLVFLDTDGRSHTVAPAAHRPLSTLPADFWIQVMVGFFAWMIAAAVWAFRPRETSARFLLFNGWTTLMFSPGAAVYTTREFGMPLAEMLLLKTMNFGGGLLFCGSMVALMLNYPRRMGPRGLGSVAIAAMAAWFIAQAFGIFDSMLVGRRIPVLVALAAMVGMAVAQWLGTRRDPVARAAMQWFLLSWVLCISLFVALTMVPQFLGVQTGAIQGYSFILFLLLYVGIAFGIIRFRLFDLGIWWFRTLAWIGGAIALITLDLLFLFGMQFSASWSLSLSLLACALLWLPFRNWLWDRTMRRPPAANDVFRHVLHVALAPTQAGRLERWQALQQQLFSPLEIAWADPVQDIQVDSDGIAMTLPGAGASPALTLRYPGAGRRLFTPADVRLAGQLVEMLAYAEESRESYAQGAREERSRIARDLHDDIGSRLLCGLHQPDLESARESMAQAIGEMRTIIHGLIGEQHPLDALEADLRHETGERLEAAGIALSWQGCDPALARITQVDYAVYKNALSAVRELTANVIRHAMATVVDVSMRLDAGRLVVDMRDDGRGFAAESDPSGHGLRNIRSRLEELGGAMQLESHPGGTRVRMEIPLRAPAAAPPRPAASARPSAPGQDSAAAAAAG
ncbi:Redox sensor histidine kinase response regulator DevS [Pigmentiphaga humi]|uniref:Redox sensor histidine kinase response regulator DevS n=1 Tax=Pigmentiphaga humi TaxID=2478468 RepID=A0A3P4B2S0_9BURK|nr:ATP-binding protein [Pigmentiphaga humi]VCU70352.1 Redox sensor histidine kinase response regulator DevS [Pigmentiphaga humi]